MVGQHIRILKGGRWVHAVDCGDETVLHLVEDAPPPRVRRAYRPEFVAGADAVEVVTHRERTFPAREIVKRAYSRASDPALAVMFQDSEAFVEWCTTGRLAAARNVALQVPGVPAVSPSAPPAKRNGAPAPGAAPRAPKAKVTVKAKPAAKAKPVAKAPARTRPAPKPAAKAKPATVAKKGAAKKPAARKAPAPAKARPAAKGRRAPQAKVRTKPAPKKVAARRPARKGRR